MLAIPCGWHSLWYISCASYMLSYTWSQRINVWDSFGEVSTNLELRREHLEENLFSFYGLEHLISAFWNETGSSSAPLVILLQGQRCSLAKVWCTGIPAKAQCWREMSWGRGSQPLPWLQAGVQLDSAAAPLQVSSRRLARVEAGWGVWDECGKWEKSMYYLGS